MPTKKNSAGIMASGPARAPATTASRSDVKCRRDAGDDPRAGIRVQPVQFAADLDGELPRQCRQEVHAGTLAVLSRSRRPAASLPRPIVHGGREASE